MDVTLVLLAAGLAVVGASFTLTFGQMMRNRRRHDKIDRLVADADRIRRHAEQLERVCQQMTGEVRRWADAYQAARAAGDRAAAEGIRDRAEEALSMLEATEDERERLLHQARDRYVEAKSVLGRR